MSSFVVKHSIALALVAMSVSACGTMPENTVVPSRVSTPQASNTTPGRSLSVYLKLPKDDERGSNGKGNRYDFEDVTELELTLSAGGQVKTTVTVRPTDDQQVARFAHLRYGVPYELTLVARGNQAGNPRAPILVLNSRKPATASICFSGNNDVDDSQAIRLPLVLDSHAPREEEFEDHDEKAKGNESKLAPADSHTMR